MEFANGKAQLTLSQNDVAKAVEFWLNERVLRSPCQVTGFKGRGVNDFYTFEVELKERTQLVATTATVTAIENGTAIHTLYKEMGQR